MNEKRRVPSEEDIARARRRDAERWSGVSRVCESVRSQFVDETPLREILTLPQGDGAYRAYAFYARESDVAACQANGVSDQIVAFLRAELERVRGTAPGQLEVAFEFDSTENVDAKFGGDYFKRLR